MFILTQHKALAPGEAAGAGGVSGSSAAGETKRCEACGASFVCYASCGASGPSACWCVQISVPAEVREQLRERYRDCLCEACLKTAGSR